MRFFCDTEEETNIAVFYCMRTSHFVGKSCDRYRRRNGVWHFTHGSDSSGTRCGCFCCHRSFVLQSRLAEMDVAVDEPREVNEGRGHQIA